MPFVEDATGAVVAKLMAAVTTQGELDVPGAMVLDWLSGRQALMCSRSRCLRRRLVIGSTVANQSSYAVPKQVVQILEVQVAGVVYGSGRHSDISNFAQNRLWIWGPGGIAMRDADVEGDDELALVPPPPQDGLPIEVYAACRPGPIVEGDDSTVRIPEEFYDALVDGAIALGLQRTESRGDIAAEFAARFESACAELLKQVNKRYKGSSPAQIRVEGVNA